MLTWLFLVSVLLSGLVPGLASADDQIPIQWQAVCHGEPGPISAPQESGDAPVESLPCCDMCCGTAHEGVWAPPLVAGRIARAPLCATRSRPDLRPLAPSSHQARPPQARGPPALI